MIGVSVRGLFQARKNALDSLATRLSVVPETQKIGKNPQCWVSRSFRRKRRAVAMRRHPKPFTLPDVTTVDDPIAGGMWPLYGTDTLCKVLGVTPRRLRNTEVMWA